MALCTCAFVIAVDCTVGFICTVTYKHGMTGAAKEFCRQQIFFGSLCLAGCVFVLPHTNRYTVKNILGNNSGYRIGNGDILISILSDISTVGKNTGEGVLVETITS